MRLTGIILAALSAIVASDFVRYDKHNLVEIKVADATQVDLVNSLQEGLVYGFPNGVDMWQQASVNGLKSAIVSVHEDQLKQLSEFLIANKLDAEMLHNNIQSMIDEATPEDWLSRNRFAQGDAAADFALNKYHAFTEINAYFDALAMEHPDTVSVINIGKSKEGRDMNIIKIGKAKAGGGKKGFVIEAGLHAREWIAVTTPTYIASELATNPQYASLIADLDFFILPSSNPDGYEYSRNTERLWRKTRSGPRQGCYGVDPNRNFDFMWDPPIGSSDNPCTDIYRGPSALSEVETANIAKWVRDNLQSANLKAYITMHTFGMYMAHSWGYAYNTYPADKQALLDLSKDAVKALQAVNGVKFTVGSSADIVYPVSGGSDDWAKGNGLQWVYLMELRGGGLNGFVLPESSILPAGKETFAAVLVVAEKVRTT